MEMLTEAAAAASLGLRPRTLRLMRVTGDGLPFCVVSRRAIRYRRDELESWLATRTFTNSGEVSAARRAGTL